MPIRQRVVTYGFSTAAVATLTVAALLQPWRGSGGGPEVLVKPVAPVQHTVDVVFAVDTTASMGGLLDGAKRTVWSIATHIRQADPNAVLRVGLVAYKDIGDIYVTRDFALTRDLDAVFAELASYRAEGGGDEPEDVDAALDDVVHKMQWAPDATKLVFLVGDAPPASRGDVPRFDISARQAGDAGIVLNTVRCGDARDTEVAWRQIAALGHGEFSSIKQDGGVQQVATPYDDEMARLSATIDSTAVIAGDDARRAYTDHMEAAAAAPAPAKADRAAYFAADPSAEAPRATGDLVGSAADVDGIAPADLPTELRSMDKPALKAELSKRGKQRAEATAKMKKLVEQRTEYLKTKGSAKSAHGADAFDSEVNATIDDQLKR